MASNYQFLREPDDSLKCLICLEVAKDPKQHGECGKLFCSECIEKNGNKPCPNCRANIPQFFMDTKSLREIKALPVRCDNLERGCVWEGTVGMLDTHVTKCGFTLISCPNKCKVEGEDSQLMRKDLDDHLKTSCPNREYKCRYCGEKGTYASITEVHDSECIKKIVPCPNAGCTSAMERGLTKKHVQTVCNYTVVACDYVSIGCCVKRMRMEMNQHVEDDNSHLRLTLVKIVKLTDAISSQNAIISSQNAAIFSLEKNFNTLEREKSMSFNLPGFSKMKEDDAIFNSEPFYTSPGGYKMCIEVYPNGSCDGKGTHVSVYSHLLEGSYDDYLWPFLGRVTFELLNQLADNNHHSGITFEITESARVGSGWGLATFIHHSKLSYNQARNIQYLMDDTLYFRVTVKAGNHKPWLDCTHPTK